MSLGQANSGAPKIVQIVVEQAKNLRLRGQPTTTRILPFYSYEFYTFEVRSATAQGSDAVFDSAKQFEVEETSEFKKYMETQQLVINLIDESVDITVPGARDFIGSVRISLLEVMRKQSLSNSFPVVDETNTQCGELHVRMSITDGHVFAGDTINRITSSTKI